MKTTSLKHLSLCLAILTLACVPTASALYNPTAGRWLSRDPAAELGGANLLGFLGNQGPNAIDKDGRVQVKRVFTSTNTCGGYRVDWEFRLDINIGTGPGWFVQEVIISKDERVPCAAQRVGLSIRYYEAWKLPPFVQGNLERTVTDTASLTSRPNTKGNNRSTGTIKYFDDSVTGDLNNPASGFRVGAVPGALALPSTYTQPSWWNSPPSRGEAVATRDAYTSWDCCCLPWYSRFTFTP
jgi:hypothetical protein